MTSTFRPNVLHWVSRIPEGRVASYGDIAVLAGSPRAARGVGAVLNALLPEHEVPWWRVVNRSGRLTIPAELGLRALQRTLLEEEGVHVQADGTLDMARYRWSGPSGSDDGSE
jgi:methylated-DNA-protein-cysteine methyltransferase-like protein